MQIKLNNTPELVPAQSVSLVQYAPAWCPPTIGDWILSVEDVPEWLIPGYIPADSNILMSGAPKIAFKSWLAFTIALSLATGKKIGPFEPVNKDGVPVLVLEAEGGRAQTKNRWIFLANQFGIDLTKVTNLRFSHRELFNLGSPEDVDKITEMINTMKVKFVVVDTFSMYASGNENSSEDVNLCMKAFVKFRENGASTLYLHHLNRPQREWKRDIDEEIRGSTALAGFYDVHYAIRKPNDTTDYNDLTIRFKEDEEKQFKMEWFIDKESARADFKMTQVTEESRSTDAKNVILTTLNSGDGATKSRLADLTGIFNLDPILDSLLDEGLIVKEGRLYKLTEPEY